MTYKKYVKSEFIKILLDDSIRKNKSQAISDILPIFKNLLHTHQLYFKGFSGILLKERNI